MRKHRVLLMLFLLSTILTAILVLPTVSGLPLEKKSASPISIDGFTNLGPGLWINESEYEISSGNLTDKGTTFDDFLFIFKNISYGIKMTAQYALNESYTASIHGVALISDPDGSLSAASPRESGDELTIRISGILTNGSYSLIRNNTLMWFQRIVQVKQNATWQRLTGDQIASLNSSIYNQWLSETNINNRTYLRNGWDYLMRNMTNTKDGSRYAYFTYRIDEGFPPLSAPSGTDFEHRALSLSHQPFDLIAYSDTSLKNQTMDVTFHRIGNFTEIPSSEAEFIFRASLAENVTESSPAYNATSETLSWSTSVGDLNGNLVAVRPGEPSVGVTLHGIAFGFRFTRSENLALIRVDEHIGALDIAGADPVNHLSLARVYYSFFGSQNAALYKTNMTTAMGTPISTESNSTELPIVGFGANQTMTAYAKIGGNSYIWGFDNSTNKADSNALTWLFFKEHSTIIGNRSTARTLLGDSRFFYETCFANWSGYSITHETLFAVFLYTPPLPQGYGQGALLAISLIIGVGIGATIAIAAATLSRLGNQRKMKRPRGHGSKQAQEVLVYRNLAHL